MLISAGCNNDGYGHKKRWDEWSPAFREISGKYFLSKSSAVIINIRDIDRSAKTVREPQTSKLD